MFVRLRRIRRSQQVEIKLYNQKRSIFMIAFEAEVPLFLLIGFTVVAILSFVALVMLFIRCRNVNLLFFLMQLLFLVLTFKWLFGLITVADNHPMLTEECSLRVGLAGICWTISTLFMFIGIYRITRKKEK